MPLIDDPRYTESAIAGPFNTSALLAPAPQEQSPSIGETLSAAARLSTLAGAATERFVNTPDIGADEKPSLDWDPLDHVNEFPHFQGWEQYAGQLADARTPAELQSRLARINSSRQDEDVLRRAGFGGPVANIVLNLLDPSMLAAAAVPELGLAKATRIGRALSAARQGAAAATAYEVAMHSVQEGRTLEESGFNIAGGALLSGVLGSLGRHIPTEEREALHQAIEADIAPTRSEVGAGSVAPKTTLQQETIGRGGAGLSKAMNKTPVIGTDLDVVMNSDSVVARQVFQDLADVTPILEKNYEGIATADSVESAAVKHDANVANLIDLAHDQLAAYKIRTPKDERLSDNEFWRAVSTSLRQEDRSSIPEVQKIAEFQRSKVFDPLYRDAKELGIVKDPAKLAQQALDEQVIHEHVGKETQRHFADFVQRGGDGTENAAISAIKKLRNNADAEVLRIPEAVNGKALKGLARVQAEQKIRAAAHQEIDKIEPHLRDRFIARARAVAEGRATETDASIQELAQLFKERESGQILDKRVPRQMANFKPELVGSPTYFRRMYDREMIRKHLDEWHTILSQHFRETSDAMPAEISSAAEDVTRTVLGNDVGHSNWNTKIAVTKAGPLKDRVLDIPDAKIEKFLVNDPLRVARAYTRDLAPQVELARRFHGDVDMQQAFQNIADDYDIKREALRNNKALTPAQKTTATTRLTDQEKRVNEAILRVRNRILGTAGRLGPDANEGQRRAVMAARGWRNWVAAGRLGMTAITGAAAMDTARTATQYGFTPTIAKMVQLARSKEFRNLSFDQARRAGSAVEVALSRRVNAAYDGAVTEGWTQRMADGLYKWTGLSHVTDFSRTLAATLFEDSVLKATDRIKAGEVLPKFERGRLAALGLGDDELKGIAEQIEKHGGDVNGIRVSGSADWTDKRLADLYDSAILKESKIVVQQPGAADRVWWMDKELGKVLGQLKTFSLSSPSRLTTPMLQMAGAGGFGGYGRFARFAGFMMVGGYLTHVLRQLLSGQEPKTDIAGATGEAFAESGLGGVIPDLVSPVARRVGLFGESTKMSDRNASSAYGGPAVGAGADAYDLIFNRTQDSHGDFKFNAKDLHLLRRLLPYQNVWWARRAINALEGETAEAMGLPGSDAQSFTQRFLETKPPLASTQRGGTGTGQLVQ